MENYKLHDVYLVGPFCYIVHEKYIQCRARDKDCKNCDGRTMLIRIESGEKFTVCGKVKRTGKVLYHKARLTNTWW